MNKSKGKATFLKLEEMSKSELVAVQGMVKRRLEEFKFNNIEGKIPKEVINDLIKLFDESSDYEEEWEYPIKAFVAVNYYRHGNRFLTRVDRVRLCPLFLKDKNKILKAIKETGQGKNINQMVKRMNQSYKQFTEQIKIVSDKYGVSPAVIKKHIKNYYG